MAGRHRARAGIERMVRDGREGTQSEDRQRETFTVAPQDWRAVVKSYREVLYAPLEEPANGNNGTMETVSEAEALRSPVRQFTEGLAVGLGPFLDLTFRMARDYFGPRRRDGAREIRWIQTKLCAMRDLRRTAE